MFGRRSKENITCMTTTWFQVAQILTAIPEKDFTIYFTRQQWFTNTSTIMKASIVTPKMI